MSIGHGLAMALRAAYWAMHRQTDSHLLRHGVTANQFVLLSLLRERDGVTQQELVRRASSDPNTVRAMLAILEGAGLVARGRHPRDGRAWRVTLTAKGRRAFERFWAASDPLRKRLADLFSPDEAEALVAYLTRISEAMVPPGRRRGLAPAPSAKSEVATGSRKSMDAPSARSTRRRS